MRRRVMAAIAVVAAVAVALFALPLARTLHTGYRDQELLRLQRDAVYDSRSVDVDPAEPGGIEVPTTGDRIGVYGLDGRRIAGDGPARADGIVRSVITAERAHAGEAGPEIVAAVPLVTRERVTGVLRVARDGSVVDHRTWTAWTLLAALALALMALAVGAASVIARRLAAPLEALAHVAQRLGRGEFDVTTPNSGVPEADAVGAALAASARRIEEMVERERAFSTHASHQLRTPLAALRIDLEALAMRTDPVPPEIEAAIGQVDRLEATITTLLSVARDLPPEPDGTDLPELLRTAAPRWRATLAGRDRRLTLDVPSTAPRCSAHAPVLREILEILVDNAITHGAGTVHLGLRSHDEDGWLDVEVRDEGDGLTGDPEAVFAQGHTSAPGRHGIGLPLARALALAENGALTLTDAGPAPCFTLRLPAVPRKGAE